MDAHLANNIFPNLTSYAAASQWLQLNFAGGGPSAWTWKTVVGATIAIVSFHPL